jgi:hypothetical protein
MPGGGFGMPGGGFGMSTGFGIGSTVQPEPEMPQTLLELVQKLPYVSNTSTYNAILHAKVIIFHIVAYYT